MKEDLRLNHNIGGCTQPELPNLADVHFRKVSGIQGFWNAYIEETYIGSILNYATKGVGEWQVTHPCNLGIKWSTRKFATLHLLMHLKSAEMARRDLESNNSPNRA